MIRPLTGSRALRLDRYQEYFASRGLLVELEGPRVRLRYVCLADAPRLYELFRDAEVSRFFTWIPPCDLAETEEYILGFQREIYRQSAYHFTILAHPDDEPIGVCNLYHIHRSCAEAEIGIWLGRPYWGMRYQADANRLLMRHAFDELGFRRLLFRVATGNFRARRAFEGLGARPAGRVFLRSSRLQADLEHVVYALEAVPGCTGRSGSASSHARER
jgi:ribosomal-protein-alanine N-acetyltransferase